MKAVKLVAISILLAAVLGALSGCLAVAAAGAAGAGVFYMKGDLDANVDATPPRVVEAANFTMKDLQYAVATTNSSATDGEVIAHTATDKKVRVTVKQVTEKSSKVTIRVGTWGDETMSVQILEKIKTHLQTPVP